MKQNRQETVSATMFPSLPRDLLTAEVELTGARFIDILTYMSYNLTTTM